MSKTKVLTIKLRSITYDIDVDDNGRFCTLVNNEYIFEPSFDALKSRISKITSKQKISIPFVRFNSHTMQIEHGEITGKHSTNNNLLVKMVGGGRAEQEYGYQSNEYLALTSVQEKTYATLWYAAHKAKTELDNFRKAYSINIHEAVPAAYAALVKEDNGEEVTEEQKAG